MAERPIKAQYAWQLNWPNPWKNFLAKQSLLSPDELYDLRSNLAYDLHYLEYLTQTIWQVHLPDTILTMLFKSYVVAAAAVIEGILHVKYKETKMKGNPDFYNWIKQAGEDGLFGDEVHVYEFLQDLRDKRNKVHAFKTKTKNGKESHAWFEFNRTEAEKARIAVLIVIYHLFEISEADKKFLTLLEKTFDVPDENF